MSIEINEGTQTTVNTSLVGGTETQVIRVDVGSGTTASEFGGTVRDVANITKGTVTRVEGGTITTSNPTGTVVEVNKGTINLGSVAVTNTPNIGTVTTLPGIPSGTINVGTFTNTGTVVNVATGTINVGTATVSGNVGVATGTITTGSITNVAMVHAGTHVHPTGTVTTIAAGTQNTLGTVGAVNTIVAGTQNTLGTVSVVNNIVTGTLAALTNLAGGTVKLNETPVNLATSLTTNGTTGVAVWGTLVAASGAGTKQYVSGVDVVVSSGTVEVAVTNIGVGGSTGAGVLTRGVFIAGGGVSKNFYPVIASGTNGTLSYWLGGAGTANITVQYWQGV